MKYVWNIFFGIRTVHKHVQYRMSKKSGIIFILYSINKNGQDFFEILYLSFPFVNVSRRA